MLELKLTGEDYPKKAELIWDDKNAEGARLQELMTLGEYEPGHPLRDLIDDTPMGPDGRVCFEIPKDYVGEMAEVLEEDWPGEAQKVYDHNQEALEALQGDL